jgi:hypothetical protein
MISITKSQDAKFVILLMESGPNDHVLLTSCGCNFVSGPLAHIHIDTYKKKISLIQIKIHKGD